MEEEKKEEEIKEEIEPTEENKTLLTMGMISVLVVLIAVIISIFLSIGTCQHKATLEPGKNYIVMLKDGNIGILNTQWQLENISEEEAEDIILNQMVTGEREILEKHTISFPKKICLDRYIKEAE